MHTYIAGNPWNPYVTVTHNGAAVDFSTYTVKWGLRTSRDAASYAVAGLPISGSGTSGGVLTATIPVGTTSLVTPGDYIEELQGTVEVGGVVTIRHTSQREVRVVQAVVR